MNYMCKKLDELRSLYVLGDYEKTSANLMKKVEWNDIPVKIEVILDRLGIPFNKKEFTQSEAELKQNNIKVGVQGMVHVEKDNIEIFYNSTYQGKRATKHKISFTLAHELSHSILQANEIDANKGFLDFYRLDDEDEYIDDDKEVEANTMAGEILLPRNTFTALFKTAMKEKTLQETKKALSEVFDVSIAVIDARIKYLKLENDINRN